METRSWSINTFRQRVAGWFTGPEARAGPILWLAPWFGALAGIADVAHLTVRHLILPTPESGFRWDLTWLAPLATSAAFLALAVALLLLVSFVRLLRRGGLGPGTIPVTPLLFGLALLGCYNALQSRHIGVHPAAEVVLSVGVAVAFARIFSSRWPALVRVVRRSSLPLAALLAAATGAGLLLLPEARERRALARLGPAPDGMPNVLLLILDTVRAASLSLYGYGKPTTPHLAKWAARGAVFDRAIATAPWTMPSHGSMLTGRHPHELSGDHEAPLDDSHPTLATVLSQAGYATAGFVANWGYGSRISGLARGFARYEDYPITWGHFLASSWLSREIAERLVRLGRRPWRVGRKNALDNTDDFLGWLAKREDGRPFFAMLNYMDAHSNYNTTPEQIMRRFDVMLPIRLPPQRDVTEAEMAPAKAAYDAAIAFLDEQLDRLFTELERRGVLDRTLVIVTSDHGEQFGENGRKLHGNTLSLYLLHVPLLVLYPPSIPAGIRIATPVSLRDLPASVMDLIGARQPAPFPGRSLRRFWSGDSAALTAEPITSEVTDPNIRSVLLYPYHYIRHNWGKQELYDVAADPREAHNLNKVAEHAGRMARLAAILDSIRAAAPLHPSRIK